MRCWSCNDVPLSSFLALHPLKMQRWKWKRVGETKLVRFDHEFQNFISYITLILSRCFKWAVVGTETVDMNPCYCTTTQSNFLLISKSNLLYLQAHNLNRESVSFAGSLLTPKRLFPSPISRPFARNLFNSHSWIWCGFRYDKSLLIMKKLSLMLYMPEV